MLYYVEYLKITSRIGLLLHHKGMKPQQRYVSIYSFVTSGFRNTFTENPTFGSSGAPRPVPGIGLQIQTDCGTPDAARRRVAWIQPGVPPTPSLEVPHGLRKLDGAHLGHEGPRRWLLAEGWHSAASAQSPPPAPPSPV